MSVVICLVCGIAIGYIYDFFRAIRKTAKYNGFLTVLSDMLFWIISGVAATAVFFFIDGMVLRFYRFCAVVCGCFVYFSLLSHCFLLISEKILKIFIFFFKILFTIGSFCGKIINRVFCIVMLPFGFLVKYMKKFGGYLKKCKKIRKRI